MISNMTGSINREVTPCQERLKASADCWLSLAAAPTFPIMALLTGARTRWRFGSRPASHTMASDRATADLREWGMVVVAVSSTAA